MVKTKKMNESTLAAILKELNVAGELIRSRQEEKQGLLDEFDEESKRFFFGKISERTLAGSVRKTNRELVRLDMDIRKNISRVKSTSVKANALAFNQAPKKFRAALSGTTEEGKAVKKKKKAKAKKVVRKKAVRKKVKKAVKKKAAPKKKAKARIKRRR